MLAAAAALLNSRQCPRRAATFCPPAPLSGCCVGRTSFRRGRRGTEAQLEMGTSVAIVGGGTLGLGMLQPVRAAGARHVFVIEHADAKRRFCELLGGHS
jgi:threonine dehydrogenase-like Zn-dependent dehydrogenase